MAKSTAAVLGLVILAAALACTGGAGEGRKTPPPGLDHVPQVFVALDSNRDDPWLRHDEAHWGAVENFRVERARVSTLEEAAEKLRTWNGRESDLVVLGPGLPQRAWKELKLAKKSRGRIVAWDPEPGLSLEGVLTLALDRASLRRLIERLCKRGCEFPRRDPQLVTASLEKEGGRRIWFGEGNPLAPVSVRVVVDWSALAGSLLQPSRPRAGGMSDRQKIGVYSGELRVEPGVAGDDEVRNVIRDWSLSELQAGSGY